MNEGRAIRARSDRRAATVSDRDLIRACREGHTEAWQRILNKYERIVFSVPRKYGLSSEDAADITQLTFTILVQSMETLPEDSSLGAWLTTVARRHTWRLLERTRRQGIEERRVPEEISSSVAGADTESQEHWELTEWLERGLMLVGEPCRELLFALYLEPEEPSYAEVAERLDMAVGSVGPTRIRCLERLRRVLDE